MIKSKYINYYIGSDAIELDVNDSIIGRDIPIEYLEDCIKSGYKLRINIDSKEILPHIYVTIRNKYIVNIIVKYIDSIEINQIQKRAIAADIIINDKELVFNILDYNTILELEREFDTGLLEKINELEVLSSTDIVNIIKECIKNRESLYPMIIKMGGKYFETRDSELIEIRDAE